MSDTPMCAHMHIECQRSRNEFGAIVREWWECLGCGTEFRAVLATPPAVEPDAPDFAAAERYARSLEIPWPAPFESSSGAVNLARAYLALRVEVERLRAELARCNADNVALTAQLAAARGREVTEAMVEAALFEYIAWIARKFDTDGRVTKEDRPLAMRRALTAALAAQEAPDGE